MNSTSRGPEGERIYFKSEHENKVKAFAGAVPQKVESDDDNDMN